MQKLGIIVIVICLLTGCATMKGDLSSYQPTAIVSVMSYGMINWEGEGDSIDGVASDFIRENFFGKRTEGKVTTSSADELIEEAAAIMYDTLSYSGIASIVPPSDVLETPAYFRAETNTRAEAEGNVKPMAYKFINNADQDLAVSLAQEEGIKSTMYLDFTFNKKIANGIGKNGSMVAQVIMRVTLLDETGKKIYFKSHEYWSTNRTEVASGAYNEEELMGLFRETLYDAASDLVNVMSNN
jgi:hypothetical protein